MTRSDEEVKVERALGTVVERFGSDRAQDAQTLRALLADELGGDSVACGREIRLVTTALAEGVPRALQQGAAEDEVATDFGQTAAFQADAATWAVRAWASALGTTSDVTPEPWSAPSPPPPSPDAPPPEVTQAPPYPTQGPAAERRSDDAGTGGEGPSGEGDGPGRTQRGARAWLFGAAGLVGVAAVAIVFALVAGGGDDAADEADDTTSTTSTGSGTVGALAATVGLSDASSCEELDPGAVGSGTFPSASSPTPDAEMSCEFVFDDDVVELSVQQWDGEVPDGEDYVSERLGGEARGGDWSVTWGNRTGPYLEGDFDDTEYFLYWEYPDEGVTALITTDSLTTGRRFWAANFVDADSPPDQAALRDHFRIISDPAANCVPDEQIFRDAQVLRRGAWSCLDDDSGTEIDVTFIAYDDEDSAAISSITESLNEGTTYEVIDDGVWRLANGEVGGSYWAGRSTSTGNVRAVWDYTGTPYRANAYGGDDYTAFLEWWEGRGSITN